MPSVSKKQHNLMAMVANDPAAAKRVGVPQSVGAEFMKADKGLKFGKGSTRADAQKINRPKTNQGKSELFAKGGDMKSTKKEMPAFLMKGKKMAAGGATKMGAVKTAAPSRDGVAVKGKTKGTMIKMMRGGKAC
jgi:hypothetical protein